MVEPSGAASCATAPPEAASVAVANEILAEEQASPAMLASLIQCFKAILELSDNLDGTHRVATTVLTANISTENTSTVPGDRAQDKRAAVETRDLKRHRPQNLGKQIRSGTLRQSTGEGYTTDFPI
jgi:hypothetical protein